MKLEFADNPCFSGVFKCNIDNTDVLGYVQEMKKSEILKEHQDSIWYSEKEGYWYCCLPDETKPKGWRNVKRKRRNADGNGGLRRSLYICSHHGVKPYHT